ncbi:hypothetical protein JHL21_12510 [Devosia sp. WQ 349]|uniref:hypothetical protein n=1 Tax=Devosia sp. WQ 349K1 TaxID=2800329 RepID=UPI001906D967|nr:hypothetical protein [Devosia sp. WQ 349K1]MBK1795319.1 hypothetical protein [Devosia sp. WQ 349K1]
MGRDENVAATNKVAKIGFIRAIALSVDRSVGKVVESRSYILIWFIVIGTFLLACAFSLGVGWVQFDGRLVNGRNVFDGAGNPVSAKEVGYFSAVNWSLFGVVIAPAIVYFGLCTVSAFDSTLYKLCANGILRDGNLDAVQYAHVRRLWEQHASKNRFLFFLIFAMVMTLMLSDWWSVVAVPLLDPAGVTALLSDPSMEYDWSVAALFSGTKVSLWPLLIFGFVGYVVLAGLVPAIVISVTICTIYYMHFVTNLSVQNADGSKSVVQFAAVHMKADEADTRFGFSAFSEFFNYFLLMSLLILAGLWLMSVQNVYLRDESSADLYNFIIGEVRKYHELANGGSAQEFLYWFIRPAERFYYNSQVAFAFLLTPFVCIIAILGCWFVLRVKAQHARQYSLQHADRIAAEQGIDPDLFRFRLQRDMDVWPVGWITSRRLVTLMLLLFVSLVSYRIIAFPLLFGFGIGIFELIRRLFSPSQ